MKKGKLILTWTILILLITSVLALTYLKFVWANKPDIEEYSPDKSNTVAIAKVLTWLADDFNQSELIKEYQNKNITVKSTVNANNLYIQYAEDVNTITYEFTYNNLFLNIKVTNDEENLKIFQPILKNLIISCQNRLNQSSSNNTTSQEEFINEIDKVIEEKRKWEGLTITSSNNLVEYRLNITKTLTFPTIEDSNDDTNNKNNNNSSNESTSNTNNTNE